MFDVLVWSTGAVPVRPVDGHSLLSAAAWPAAVLRGQGERETPFPSDHRSRGGPGSEERSHALLDTGETQVDAQSRSHGFKVLLIHRNKIKVWILGFLTSSNISEGHSFISAACFSSTCCSGLLMYFLFDSPSAGWGWTWWEKCTTVPQSSPAVLWRTATTAWPVATRSTTASPGSVLSAGQNWREAVLISFNAR